MNKDEALRLALEALEKLDRVMKRSPDTDKAIIAIKQALAQPEQDGYCKHCTNGCFACDARKQPEPEPMAWMDADGDLYKKLPSDDWHPPHTPLYTSPPKREWQGLTYGEVLEQKKDDPIQFYRAIEAKLKEKNT